MLLEWHPQTASGAIYRVEFKLECVSGCRNSVYSPVMLQEVFTLLLFESACLDFRLIFA